MTYSAAIPTPSSPEALYIAGADRAHRKRMGQFFTPEPVADLMADWVAQGQPERVCDPAAGTGVLARAMIRRAPSVSVLALEKDPDLAAMMQTALGDPEACLVADYLNHNCDGMDAFIVNPPYVRHRHLAEYAHARAQLNVASRGAVSVMANLYVYFCVKILADLRPGGRASILLPGEWMNANFARPFKTHLMASGALQQIVAFSNASELFDDALTTASLLLLEKPQ